ncbi:SDR family NAD(P)-dependent oxidoreductase, partial [Micromonospora sp. DT201]|uniref:SDR family NAD(P)-dependent oxidoreductase n=1 Tax=Micromonospora sp. DT201 TaxID=3393442 RepID=UPI003CF8480A
ADLVLPAGVFVAAVNGPSSTVVSGDVGAVEAFVVSHGDRARRLPVDYASHCAHVDVLRTELEQLQVTPGPGRVPFYSTVSPDETTFDAGYWFRNLRQPVRFHDAVTRAVDDGLGLFVEVSPHPALLAAIEDTGGTAVGSLRRDQPGPDTFLTNLAQAHTYGADLDWTTLDIRAGHVDLPTYPFQHQRYWLASVNPDDAGSRPTDLGLESLDHSLLGAAVPLPDSDGHLFTGRVSRQSHPWLADHGVLDTVLLPGAVFVDLAARVAEAAGHDRVDDLVLHAPLLLPDRDDVQLRATTGALDTDGRRPLAIHSRTGAGPWIRHAEGTLANAPAARPADPVQWPPHDASPVDLSGAYEGLAEAGYQYGPAFRGLRAAWRSGADVYAEVSLPEGLDAGRFTLHPALLDATLHALALLSDAGTLAMPFAWTGVTVHAIGATSLTARLHRNADGTIRLALADRAGQPVATVEALATREVTAAQLAAARLDAVRTVADRPLALHWTATGPLDPADPRGGRWAVLGDDARARALRHSLRTTGVEADSYASLAALTKSDGPAPATVLAYAASATPRAATQEILDLLQDWLADDRYVGTHLVLVTSGAVAAIAGETVIDLATASLWGLVRSAQTEHPGRFTLLDIDQAPIAWPAFPAVEPQLASRAGTLFAPRLTATGSATTSADTAPEFDPAGTVLITGGTGTLGRLTARHLVNRHGVRHLLLISRRGPDAAGAAELRAELTGLGATVTIEACDIADRAQVARLLAAVPADHPLTSVIHTAGALHDATLTALSPAHLHDVLPAKIDAATHLHELTAALGLRHFVLFSSTAAVLGAPGQANYAAGNAYLDALARYRHGQGLPATSIAWGLWADASAMTGGLTAADQVRLERAGMPPLTIEQGLALLDAALTTGDPYVVALRLDTGRIGAATTEVPALLRELVRRAPRRAATGDVAGPSLGRWLAGVPEAEREAAMVREVSALIAAVLGHASADAIDAERSFKEFGFDSLTAVQLRNRVNARTGLRLPATLAFDHPTPLALARHALAELSVAAAPVASTGPEESQSPLGVLYRQAHQLRRPAAAGGLLRAAGELRSTYAGRIDLPALPAADRLADGPAQPELLCFPPFVPVPGAMQYAQFSAALEGMRSAWLINPPGFADGESLPADLDAAVDVHADALAEHVRGRPVVLVGYSSGGLLAHAVTRCLEDRVNVEVVGLVLLDTYLPGDLSESMARSLHEEVFERGTGLAAMDFASLTAMGRYLDLFAGWQPAPVDAPTLIIRPERRVPALPGDEGDETPWQARWNLPHDLVTVPGDHCTMVTEFGADTGRAVHDWLRRAGDRS